GGRLYRSTDRGDAWREEARSGLPSDAYINSVTIDYQHPETMYAVATQGIYRRQGEGAWELVNTLYARTLAVDLQDSNLLWAGVFWRASDMDAVIVKSWEPLDLGAFQPGAGGDCCYPYGAAYDPNAGLLYVGCAPSRPTGKAMLLRSANADAADSSAIRWEAVTSALPEAAQEVGYTRPLAVDAREPRSLLALASFWEVITCPRYSLLVSHDDGATWETLQLSGLPQAPGQ
ncbi:MAG TPA: hypothetical protein PLB78_08905, partial [Anaerolineae bacterium]|nr:hypothetical protein [Anaerolineae bacterium]